MTLVKDHPKQKIMLEELKCYHFKVQMFSVKIVNAFSQFSQDQDSTLSCNFNRLVTECLFWFKDSKHTHKGSIISITNGVPSL